MQHGPAHSTCGFVLVGLDGFGAQTHTSAPYTLRGPTYTIQGHPLSHQATDLLTDQGLAVRNGGTRSVLVAE